MKIGQLMIIGFLSSLGTQCVPLTFSHVASYGGMKPAMYLPSIVSLADLVMLRNYTILGQLSRGSVR